jgi:hypothetical protein
MANGENPSEPKKATQPGDALRNYLGNLPTFAQTLDQALARAATLDGLQRDLRGEVAGDEPISTAISTAVPTTVTAKGGIAGKTEDKPKRTSRRDNQGKASLQGGNRTVRFYKPTEAELDRLGELSREEGFAWAKFSFCVGLLANVALGMIFATGLSNGSKGAGEAIGACAILAGGNFLLEALRKRRIGRSALEQLKKDHDFTVKF